jgi:hypothetical protein
MNAEAAPVKGSSENQAAAKQLDASSLSRAADIAHVVVVVSEPQPDPFCGRCNGPSGPEGAWCGGCIRECKEYTRRLDLGEAAA